MYLKVPPPIRDSVRAMLEGYVKLHGRKDQPAPLNR
jgi:hypothetical protein